MPLMLATISHCVFQNLLQYYRFRLIKQGQKRILSGSILAYVTAAKEVLFPNEKLPEENIPTLPPTIPDLLQEADSLFAKRQYREAYELLIQVRNTADPNVLWRISRVLFQMITDTALPESIKQQMINEAYITIKQALINGDNCADVHKWLAILIDTKSGQKGIYEKAKAIPEIKKYLKRSLELNPHDITVLYMLGHLSYQLASLTWFQIQLVTILLAPPPTSSYQEAYEYFMQAEVQKPRYFTSNVFMLAKSCYKMGNYYRAKYYFDIAAGLSCKTESERVYREKAKRFSEELKGYDISKNVLFHEESVQN